MFSDTRFAASGGSPPKGKGKNKRATEDKPKTTPKRPARPPKLTVHTHGLMNPKEPNGSCLWAWVAFDARGQIVASERGEQGNGFGVTANVAKFHAVIQALGWLAVNAPKTPAEVLCDLKLVVHSVNDGWNNILPHVKQLCQMAKTFLARTKAELVWIPKERNKAVGMFKEERKPARKSRTKAA